MTVVSRPCRTIYVSTAQSATALRTHVEAGDTLDVAGQNVELLLGVLVVVSLPLEPDSDSVGGRSDTSGPDGLVQGRADAHVLDAHRLLSELNDGLDGLGSP